MAKKPPYEIDLTDRLRERFKPYPRTIGRYSVSDLWAILSRNRYGQRYKDAKEWLYQETPDLAGMARMYNGIIQHEQVQFMLDKDRCEVKVEHPFNDLMIVSKADYLPAIEDDEYGWEFKTSDVVIDKKKPWHVMQAKFYCTLYNRPAWRILQPLMKEGEDGPRLILREVGIVKRDDEWVNRKFLELEAFHNEEMLPFLATVPPDDLARLVKPELSTDDLDKPLTEIVKKLA